jgi:hypothetical protein
MRTRRASTSQLRGATQLQHKQQHVRQQLTMSRFRPPAQSLARLVNSLLLATNTSVHCRSMPHSQLHRFLQARFLQDHFPAGPAAPPEQHAVAKVVHRLQRALSSLCSDTAKQRLSNHLCCFLQSRSVSCKSCRPT